MDAPWGLAGCRIPEEQRRAADLMSMAPEAVVGAGVVAPVSRHRIQATGQSESYAQPDEASCEESGPASHAQNLRR